ncbi:hypothetical protein MPER_02246, partial [Moniliophthora perniciosa FA553]
WDLKVGPFHKWRIPGLQILLGALIGSPVQVVFGVVKAAIIPAFFIEQTRRVGYWFLMNGFAVIFLGFLAFGVLHTNASFMPWQWLMIITGANQLR